MEPTPDVRLAICADCPHRLDNPDDLPPETVTKLHQHQLGCLQYRQHLTAHGARFTRDTSLHVAGLMLDLVTHVVGAESDETPQCRDCGNARPPGAPLVAELTPHEFRLLTLLMQHPNQTCDHELILRQVWGYAADPGTNIVEQHIAHLRAKLNDPDKKLIKAEYGVGYKLVA